MNKSTLVAFAIGVAMCAIFFWMIQAGDPQSMAIAGASLGQMGRTRDLFPPSRATYSPNADASATVHGRHSGMANVLWYDGHIKAMKPSFRTNAVGCWTRVRRLRFRLDRSPAWPTRLCFLDGTRSSSRGIGDLRGATSRIA